MPWKITKNKPDLSIPVWPELSADQKSEALAADWPKRLKNAFGSAAILALLMAAIAYVPTPGEPPPWRVALSLAMFGVFLFAYFRLEVSALPSRWLALIGLTTIVTTQINLMTCVAERALAGMQNLSSSTDPTLILFSLVTGTLWALRIHLALDAFLSTAAITISILWLPWMVLTGAPVEFLVFAAACFATGAYLRRMAVQRAYESYRREILWPEIWRQNIRAEVELELLALEMAVEHPLEPFAVED
jgi:hypothetical protein